MRSYKYKLFDGFELHQNIYAIYKDNYFMQYDLYRDGVYTFISINATISFAGRSLYGHYNHMPIDQLVNEMTRRYYNQQAS